VLDEAVAGRLVKHHNKAARRHKLKLVTVIGQLGFWCGFN